MTETKTKPRYEQFIEDLREAGGSARILWSCRRDPKDRYDNVFYVACYGKAGKHGHPLACGLILNELEDGLEVLIASSHRKADDDIKQILDWGDKKSTKPTGRLHRRISIYQGHGNTDHKAEPDWTGSIEDYWEKNQDSLTYGDISQMLQDIQDYGYHNIGGGAAGCFTIRYGR